MKKIPEKIYRWTIFILLIALIITLYGWWRAARTRDFYDEFIFDGGYLTNHCLGDIDEPEEEIEKGK
jgi:hypothetical protein